MRVVGAISAVISLAFAAAAFATPQQATVHGQVVVVPNIFMCVQPPNHKFSPCNAYHGPVIFCAASAAKAGAILCAKPAAATNTDSAGIYKVVVPLGHYSVYLRGTINGWQRESLAVTQRSQTANLSVRRVLGHI